MQGLNMAAAGGHPPSAAAALPPSKDLKQGHESAAERPTKSVGGGAGGGHNDNSASSVSPAINGGGPPTSHASGGGGSGGGSGVSSSSGGGGGSSSSSGGPPKKMSWATVASQPAKPTPSAVKNKKPGVLSPPVLPGKPNLDIGTWEGGVAAPAAPPPVHQNGGGPPPLMSIPPPSGPPKQSGPPQRGGGGGWAGVAGPRGGGGRPPSGGGPPPPMGNGFNPVTHGAGGGPMAHPQPPPSHPVLDSLKSTNNYNPREFDLNPKNARFFVVKSYSEDDIHRSIKYEIWCSTGRMRAMGYLVNSISNGINSWPGHLKYIFFMELPANKKLNLYLNLKVQNTSCTKKIVCKPRVQEFTKLSEHNLANKHIFCLFLYAQLFLACKHYFPTILEHKKKSTAVVCFLQA